MKRILLIAICLLFAGMAHAQKSLLSLDEHNKYIYYQVVDLPKFSADSLDRNAAGFVKAVYPKAKSKSSKGNVTVSDKFLTYTSIVKHESGEINYTLTIECKDQKYRYWITDFTFTPYQKDRFGNFVPIAGIAVPLESASAKYDKKDTEGYLNQTAIFCKQVGENLKQYMINAPAPKKEEITKKVVTEKW
jgi:hypothetical protein